MSRCRSAAGRRVHYVLPAGPCAGECRPAIIVRSWRVGAGKADLVVLTRGEEDAMAILLTTRGTTISGGREPGTCHDAIDD